MLYPTKHANKGQYPGQNDKHGNNIVSLLRSGQNTFELLTVMGPGYRIVIFFLGPFQPTAPHYMCPAHVGAPSWAL